MLKLSAVVRTAARLSMAAMVAACVAGATPAFAMWDEPWKDESRALVIDAYEFNPINWQEMTSDERIAGFVSKASDGLPPAWSCRGLSGDDERLCKNRWWKYSVTQELYFTRREMAKMLGLKWGAYHLGRPGNPREQADHFIDFAKPEADELIALDIEDNDPEEWMSLADAEIFAEQIRIRLGRYPVLYTNGNTAEYISRNAEEYPLLSRLPLWYARYREDITGRFPEETWPQYALWQFASMHNCNARSCPYRIKGTKTDIDVNVSPLTVAELKEAWPFNDLVGDAPPPPPRGGEELLVAEADRPGPSDGLTLAAYGADERRPIIDPLELLTQAARQEHREAERSPVLSSLTTSAKRIEPDIPGDSVARRRSPPIRTQDVSAGLLDAIGQLEGEMAGVRAVLRPAPPHGPLADSTPVPVAHIRQQDISADERTAARSRIAEQLRQAVERQLAPGLDRTRDAEPERRSSLDGATTSASFASSQDRISSAFRLTR